MVAVLYPAPQRNADAIAEGLFTFYNDQLFRIVITHERYQVEGLSVDDIIQSISARFDQQ
jgi:hypothetical protein